MSFDVQGSHQRAVNLICHPELSLHIQYTALDENMKRFSLQVQPAQQDSHGRQEQETQGWPSRGASRKRLLTRRHPCMSCQMCDILNLVSTIDFLKLQNVSTSLHAFN